MARSNGASRKCGIPALVAMIVLATMLLLPAARSEAQPESIDSVMAKQEEARLVEGEIAELEEELAKVHSDWLSISRRLEEIEKRIVTCYMEIDAAEQELETAKKRLNTNLRMLYREGRGQTLVELFSAGDVSEFLVRCDRLLDSSSSTGEYVKEVATKRKKLLATQDQLTGFKKEAVRLARSSDGAAIQARIDGKRQQLAEINASVVSMSIPITRSTVSSTFSPSKSYAQPDENGFVRTGQIMSGYTSWYGNEFHGKATASGEVFDQYGFTCAHKTLPFGTWLRVTHRGRSVVVKVNDRGPFVSGRMLDLSRAAADAVGVSGVQWVDCEIIVPK